MPNLKEAWTKLRSTALTYPEAYEESPWGELAMKVRKKAFVFMGPGDGSRLSLSLKLPDSSGAALELPEAAPTGYGLGKHGWVSFRFEPGADPPMGQILDWLDESYRAVAPKRLVRALLERPSPVEAPPPPQSLDGTRILLIGNDPLRLKRASTALTDRGADALPVDLAGALDAAGAGAPDAVVVDLSRNAREAIGLLADLGLVVQCPVFVAGVRNAPMERELASHAGFAWTSREPPGEPQFLDALVARLSGPLST